MWEPLNFGSLSPRENFTITSYAIGPLRLGCNTYVSRQPDQVLGWWETFRLHIQEFWDTLTDRDYWNQAWVSDRVYL